MITHDPRGISNSPMEDPTRASTPDERADDVVAVLDAVGAAQADFFGSSGGAVTGLALLTRHPSRVRTMVAHEPPLLSILPDAAGQMALTDDIVATFHRAGVEAALGKFMAQAGFDQDEPGPDAHDPAHLDTAQWELSEQDIADSVRMFGYDILGTTRYRPDVAALTARPGQVVLGIGVASGHLLTYRTTAALADLLSTPMVEFPGDHGGFLPEPGAFADVLKSVLAQSPARV